MSQIYFHSKEDTVGVSGSERYHAETLCHDVMWHDLGDATEAVALLRQYLPREFRTAPADDVRLYLESRPSFGGGTLHIEGHDLDVWTMAMNSALSNGGDALRLLTRLHGQCELHCWVDGPNRDWLASLVEAGISDGVLRDGMGWDDVPPLLRSQSDEPVVCSFSVSESFPNFEMLPSSHRLKRRLEKGDDIDDVIDAYYRTHWRTRWRDCVKGLKPRGGRLEMKPEDWAEYYFSNGVTTRKLIGVLKAVASQVCEATAPVV